MFTQTTTRNLYTLDELDEAAREAAHSDYLERAYDLLRLEYEEINASIETFNDSIGVKGRWIDMHGPGTEKYFYQQPDVFEALEMINDDLLDPVSDGLYIAEDMREAWARVITPGVRASLRYALYVCDVHDRFCEVLELEEPDTLIYDALEAEGLAARKICEALEAVAAAVNEDSEALDDYRLSTEALEEDAAANGFLYTAAGHYVGPRDMLEGLEEVAA